MKQKKEDDAFSDQMKESMKILAKDYYSSEKIKLDVVQELETRSKANRETEENKENEEGAKDDAAPKEIDIRLRESLRIMSDWIRFRSEVTGTVTEPSPPAKES